MAKQPRTQFDIDAAGSVGEHVAAQAAQGSLEQHDAEQADGDDVQGAQAAMHQHLVHHHLEEQGCDQGKDLQHEGHQQHLAKQLAILDDGRDEPGEVEFRQLAGQGSLGADQNQLAGPARRQILEAQDLGTLGQGIVDQCLAVVDARDDEEAPVGRSGNGRKRGVDEALDLAASRLGLEAQPLGGQQQFRLGEGAAILGEFMNELFGSGGNIMEAGQHDQACKSAIDGRGRTCSLVCG